MKSNQKTWILSFVLSIGFFLLNIFQGSVVNVSSDQCFPVSISIGIGVFALTILLITLLFKGVFSNYIKIIFLPILFSSILTERIEPYIFDYQLKSTNRNLEFTCNSIANYKSKKGELPNELSDLGKCRNFNSAFQIINNEFQYIKIDDDNFILRYKVKFGYICEARNCSTFYANLEYTCVSCGTVENTEFIKEE